MDDFTQDNLASVFAEKRLNPILCKRMGADDVLSETYVNAAKRLDYFAAHDDVHV